MVTKRDAQASTRSGAQCYRPGRMSTPAPDAADHPGAIDVRAARVTCAALCAFDIGLGGLTLIAPTLYGRVFHPELSDPQLELIQRLGAVWLAFAVVAAVAATRKGADRAPWFLAVCVLRWIEVPADLVYGALADGASTLSRVLIFAAPPLNFIVGAYLLHVARALWRSERAPAAPPPSGT